MMKIFWKKEYSGNGNQHHITAKAITAILPVRLFMKVYHQLLSRLI